MFIFINKPLNSLSQNSPLNKPLLYVPHFVICKRKALVMSKTGDWVMSKTGDWVMSLSNIDINFIGMKLQIGHILLLSSL